MLCIWNFVGYIFRLLFFIILKYIKNTMRDHETSTWRCWLIGSLRKKQNATSQQQHNMYNHMLILVIKMKHQYDMKVNTLTVLKLQSLATRFILLSPVPVVLIMSFASGIVQLSPLFRLSIWWVIVLPKSRCYTQVKNFIKK